MEKKIQEIVERFFNERKVGNYKARPQLIKDLTNELFETLVAKLVVKPIETIASTVSNKPINKMRPGYTFVEANPQEGEPPTVYRT